MGWVIAILAPVVLIGAMIGVIVWRGLQVRQLVERGVPVTGRVDRKFKTGGNAQRRLAYVWRGPDGVEHRAVANMGIGEWNEYEEGDPIAVICLPDAPNKAALASLVEHARGALAKKRG